MENILKKSVNKKSVSNTNNINFINDDHQEKEVVIAFDTSNYTSSLAILSSNGEVVGDFRKILDVPSGKRGLRQSEALFQHVINMPNLLEEAMKVVGNCKIIAVAASNRPRPVEGSYMPVFLSGTGLARSLAATLDVPLKLFSHQEGHIAAARKNVKADFFNEKTKGLVFHLSGGTGELLVAEGNMPISIVGGTLDISFGQLLDRIGVAMGMKFPAGEEMDGIAIKNKNKCEYHYSRKGNLIIDNALLPNISMRESYINLSGIETAILHRISDEKNKEGLIVEIFLHIGEAIYEMVKRAAILNKIDNITLAGGVSASKFLQNYLGKRFDEIGIKTCFSEPKYSVDNAVGIALLALEK